MSTARSGLKAPPLAGPFLLPGTEYVVFESLTLPRIQPCPMGGFLADLDEKSRTNLEIAFASELSNNSIRQALITEASRPFSVDTIGTHRKGKCRCSSL